MSSVHALGRRVLVVGPTPAAHQQLSPLVMIRCFALYYISVLLLDPTVNIMPRVPLTNQLIFFTRCCYVANLTETAPHQIGPQSFSAGNFPLLAEILCSALAVSLHPVSNAVPTHYLPQTIILSDGATCTDAPLAGVPRHTRL